MVFSPEKIIAKGKGPRNKETDEPPLFYNPMAFCQG
jgi:hypothetical protein